MEGKIGPKFAFLLIVVQLRAICALNITYISNPEELPYANWMSYFQDFLIGDLPVIPASHDSAAAVVSPSESWVGSVGWLYARTQDLSIFNQLMLGVRLVDFRITITYDAFDRENSVDLSHTYKSNTTLLDGLVQITRFLELYPTETVLVLLRIDTASPLISQVRAKRTFIESIIKESNISFVNISSLASVRVKDVAGQAVLLTPKNVALSVNSTVVAFIDSNKTYSVCDMWSYTSVTAARKNFAQCFPEIPLSMQETGNLTGYALDGHFDQLWPNLTSREMNDWFVSNFQENENWATRKKYPLGVFMIDFVNKTYMSVLIDYAMNFVYPYPYYGEAPPAWKPGSNISYEKSFATPNTYLAFVAMIFIITTN